MLARGHLSIRGRLQGEDHLAAALASAPGSFIDMMRLVYMKLKASRLQDRADIGGLVKTGLDVDACRAYLAEKTRPRS